MIMFVVIERVKRVTRQIQRQKCENNERQLDKLDFYDYILPTPIILSLLFLSTKKNNRLNIIT